MKFGGLVLLNGIDIKASFFLKKMKWYIGMELWIGGVQIQTRRKHGGFEFEFEFQIVVGSCSFAPC